MKVGQWLRTTVREHPRAADAALAAFLLALTLTLPDPDGIIRQGGAGVVTILVCTCLALAFRRRWPVPVLVWTTVGAGSATLFGGGRVVGLAALIALFTVAVRSNRRVTWTAWAWSAVALTTTSAMSLGHPNLIPDALAYLGWTGAAAAAGDALRNRRAYLASLEERAARAERIREEEARRRVVEERMRIARELHDVVAHRIAVVNVQAGVAKHLLRTSPDAAEEALDHVRQASRAVLDEVADILDVLRRSDDLADPKAPAAGLAQLDPLVASFVAAGLEVDWSITGHPVDIGPTVDLVAYRVLQEALTNAHKHGTGTAHLQICYSPSCLALSVTNPIDHPRPSPDAAHPLGYGLLGMQERTAAVHGRLRAGPASDGTFHVEAQLPLQLPVS